MLRRLTPYVIFPGAFIAPAIAVAATVAVTTANVNLRAGPGTGFPVVTTIPSSSQVTVYGCVPGYSWCDVSWGPSRGWLAAAYIQVGYAGRPVVITPAIAPRLGLAVVAFDRAYWRRHYVGHPWSRRWRFYVSPH